MENGATVIANEENLCLQYTVNVENIRVMPR